VERCWKGGTNFIPKTPQGKTNVWMAMKRYIDDFNGYWSGHLAWWGIDGDDHVADNTGCAMAQKICHWVCHHGDLILVWGQSTWDLWGHSGTGTDFSPRTPVFSLSVSFHQFSTFIHLPLMWYNLSNWECH